MLIFTIKLLRILLSVLCAVLSIGKYKQHAAALSLLTTRISPFRRNTAALTAATPEIVTHDEVVKFNGRNGATHGESHRDSRSSAFSWLQTDENIFTNVAARAAICLQESDMRRDAIGEKNQNPTHPNSWIQDASAFALQKTLDKIKLKLPDERFGIDRDEASSWIRWMKTSPTPMIINLSEELRSAANTTISDHTLDLIDQTRSQFLSRLGCRLILLPSGARLDSPLSEAPASVIYGKLLFGGVSRFRLLGKHQDDKPLRKAGERIEVKPSPKDNIPVWMQYGGPDRMYQAMDMGTAAILEIAVIPRGATFSNAVGNSMVLGNMVWRPQNMFDFIFEDEVAGGASQRRDEGEYKNKGYTPISLSGRERNEAFQSDFQSSVGGLQPQIDAIVRRVLDGRIIRPAEDDSTRSDAASGDSTTQQLALASMEAEELALLGLTPVRGLLMYGPPGCGKTALAREISRALKARAPKIISAPELLDRWVGGSEKLVRALFADAEAELAAWNGDASRSALHVIVIDEIDAVFRKRSSAEDSGEATRSSVVNQILAKLDGVNAIPNVLLIGMTNRRELLDEALLRPGRLEVQIEIPLPDKEGRREILQIHFDALRKKGRLSEPLCRAIDGIQRTNAKSNKVGSPVDIITNDDGLSNIRKGRKRRAVKRAFKKIVGSVPVARRSYDIAADYATGSFSGADIAGLVRCAGSIALSRARKDGSGIEGLLITLDDVKQAIHEVRK